MGDITIPSIPIVGPLSRWWYEIRALQLLPPDWNFVPEIQQANGNNYPIGLGCQKLRDNSDYSELGRPLSSGVTSIPERELLYQAHRYVETELATGDVEVSNNLRWVAHGPHPVVTTYNSYAINGCHYHTKSHDKNKTIQNSAVSLVAKTMQIHSYTMELPTDEDLTLGLDEVEIGLDNAHTDHLEQVDASKNEKKKTRGLTLMHDVTSNKKGSFEEQDFGRANMWKKARTKKDGGYINEDVQQVANEIDEILDKAPNEESPNDALTQALGTPEYGGRVRGVGGFITPTIYFHQAKPRKSNKVDTTQQIIDKNEALRKLFESGNKKFKASQHRNMEEVIATTPMTKNEVKSSRPITKKVEVTSEPSNLPIQLKYILRYAERLAIVLERLELETFVMTSKQDQLVVAPYNPGALTIFQSQKNLKKTRKTTFWKAVKCPLQVGTVECGYYVMTYMHEIVSKDTSIITDAIDTRNSYLQLELDEVRVEWAEFLSQYI
ncbi:uncharacterized protein E5676_scaffold530G00570 [Cucumis melo var. makuwa]|uniref:Transposase n=1 Tax=Cucumis melo var. makuwa TaxID=1194695 RepID=A0A5D3DGD5_CUCMM|nr:uncharacterized protein E5676_scaffold530G00570 [Cucumis melo var. makuwa]